MMLFRNDIFQLAEVDGTRSPDAPRFRYLQPGLTETHAWAIALDDPTAVPVRMNAKALEKHARKMPPNAQGTGVIVHTASDAMKQVRDKAWPCIEPLVANIRIFEKCHRGPLLKEHASKVGVCARTLINYLRRYWQGGQVPDALLGKFHDPDRASATHLTANRGPVPRIVQRKVFQITEDDLKAIHKVIKTYFLKDERRTLVSALQHLLETNYFYVDGNGKKWLHELGNRPSRRQFEHILRRDFSLETRIRARKGDKEFERNHRPSTGSVDLDCRGPGHIFEIDGTIGDIYLVASADVLSIIGKPTIYFVVDRSTRLIVGFFIGLETPSWTSALEAILSLTTDKAALCKQYGVDYDPADWPAHGVLPEEFFADRGDLWGKTSDQICADLHKTVTNMPALRPDWKPIVEGTFHLMHVAIADVAPAYDPPSNAKKRRGKKYSQDACLTLDDFIKLILLAIIKHNRSPRLNTKPSLKDLVDDIEQSPIDLWNHGIRTRSGLLSVYTEAEVRYALLPRDKAMVSEDGICFKGCYYTSPEAVKYGWMVRGRKKRFAVEVSYESRLVDTIYVRSLKDSRAYTVATLLPVSNEHRGRSFAQVQFYEALRKANEPGYTQSRAQRTMEFHENTDPLIANAKVKLKLAGKKSRSARKADTKVARAAELQREREKNVKTLPRQDTAPVAAPLSSGSNIVSINTARTSPDPAINKLPGYLQDMLPKEGQSPEPEATPSARPSILSQELLDALKRQMTNG